MFELTYYSISRKPLPAEFRGFSGVPLTVATVTACECPGSPELTSPGTTTLEADLVKLLPSQMDLIEGQLDGQESAMTGRFSSANTRAAVLIGASGVLGGTDLVIASGDTLISAASLSLYLIAADLRQ